MKIHDPEEPRPLFKDELLEFFLPHKNKEGQPIDWSGLEKAIHDVCEKAGRIIDPDFDKKRELRELIDGMEFVVKTSVFSVVGEKR